MKKIAFLNIYNGVVNRGAETFVKELASRLSSKYKVDVFQAGEAKGNENYRVIQIPVKISSKVDNTGFFSRFFITKNDLSILFFTLKAVHRILKEKPDVVIPVNGGWMPAILRIVTWIYGGKLVISGQSGVGWDDRNNLWCFPNVFVALSSYAASWAKRANPFVRVAYIPNGVDLIKFRKLANRKDKDKSKVVLAACAFVKSKRLDLAIEAVSRLNDVKLIIAGGGGDLRDKICDLGSRKLGDRFEIVSVPFEDMPEVYRKADVFTLPSESSEAFGNVLVEAMASGLPVVATDDPIRREIVGKAGILVDPKDIDSYTTALETALKKDWGNLPRKQAEKFSWDRIAKMYDKLFEEII